MKNSGHKLQIFVLNTNTEHCTQNEVFHSGFLQSFQSLTNALVTFSQNIVYLQVFSPWFAFFIYIIEWTIWKNNVLLNSLNRQINPEDINHDNQINTPEFYPQFSAYLVTLLTKSLMKNFRSSHQRCSVRKGVLKAPEHEYIFSKYSWNLIKSIILMIFWRVAWNYLNNCLRNCVYIYIYVCF